MDLLTFSVHVRFLIRTFDQFAARQVTIVRAVHKYTCQTD